MGSPNLVFILLSHQKKKIHMAPKNFGNCMCNYIKGAWAIGSFCGYEDAHLHMFIQLNLTLTDLCLCVRMPIRPSRKVCITRNSKKV